MIDPNEKHGCAEPKQNGATENNGADYRSFRLVCGMIWKALVWPYRRWRGGDHHRRTANATAILAVATLFLALANVGMLVEMRRSGDQQHRDTLAAVGKTDETIKALHDQARIMSDQFSITVAQ